MWDAINKCRVPVVSDYFGQIEQLITWALIVLFRVFELTNVEFCFSWDIVIQFNNLLDVGRRFRVRAIVAQFLRLVNLSKIAPEWLGPVRASGILFRTLSIVACSGLLLSRSSPVLQFNTLP